MTKCDGKTEQGKRQFLPPVIADTAMQIEHIVTTSLGASSQIDFILCSNNPILKFYSPLAGGEWSWTRLGNSVWQRFRMLGFAETDGSLPELTVSPGPVSRPGYQQTFPDAKLSVSTG